MSARTANKLLLAYYGDDFTGSTDVLEALSRAKLKTVLFLKPPSRRQLQAFAGLRAFGIAGGSRAMSPEQMERELPLAFRALKASGAAFMHYKTCSTFDSSPKVGSIGKAIELGRRVFGESITPLVVGAPVLGRYVVFGNLFARSGLDAEPSRLDRHPTMSRHPVTPMDEADLRLHLATQTNLPIELVDVLKLEASRSNGRNRRNEVQDALKEMAARKSPPIVLFDTMQEADLPVIGRLISSQRPSGGQLFCAGSSGVEYALVAHWRETGDAMRTSTVAGRAARNPVQVITISGSCSPVTDRQIGYAAKHGFMEIACDTASLADPKKVKTAVVEATARAQRALRAGQSVIFQTARGLPDSRRVRFGHVARAFPGRTSAEKAAGAGEALGRGLARILEQALEATGARRAVVCGGDTSSAVARALGIEAAQFVASTAPGAPLCRVHAPGRVAHGCEIIFKGGQVGRDSFLPDLLDMEAK